MRDRAIYFDLYRSLRIARRLGRTVVREWFSRDGRRMRFSAVGGAIALEVVQ